VNEKYSYLVVKKGKTPNAEVEEDEGRFLKSAWEKSYFWSRVIRPVILKDKHIIMDLCTPRAEIERRIIAKSHGIEGGYRKAKKTKWGDLWYFERRIPNKYRKEGKFGKRLW